MTRIDTRPAIVDIDHYAGNTLTLQIKAPAAYSPGLLEWKAQVRATSVATAVDAEFDVTTGVSGDPEVVLLYLSLSSAVTTSLNATKGVVITVREKGSTIENTIRRYSGFYDIQVAGVGGTDPVITVSKGELIIDSDITRG